MSAAKPETKLWFSRNLRNEVERNRSDNSRLNSVKREIFCKCWSNFKVSFLAFRRNFSARIWGEWCGTEEEVVLLAQKSRVRFLSFAKFYQYPTIIWFFQLYLDLLIKLKVTNLVLSKTFWFSWAWTKQVLLRENKKAQNAFGFQPMTSWLWDM